MPYEIARTWWVDGLQVMGMSRCFPTDEREVGDVNIGKVAGNIPSEFVLNLCVLRYLNLGDDDNNVRLYQITRFQMLRTTTPPDLGLNIPRKI